MTSPILAADSASSYPATPTTYALPSINPAGGNVVLYALVAVDTASLVTITPDAPGWSLKETNYADGTTTAIFRKSVPAYAGPYADTFHVAVGAVWGVIQFAFRSAGGAYPANSNQDTDLFACVTNPSSSVTAPRAATVGNLILGFVSEGGCGPPYTGSLTWSYGAGWAEIFDEEVIGIGCAYRVASGAVGERTFSVTRDQNKISSQVTFVIEDSLLEDPTESVAIGWDVFDADALLDDPIATFVNAKGRYIRTALHDLGEGGFVINRHAPEATEAVLAEGNMVKVRIPDCGPAYIDGFFLGPDGDYTLLSPAGGRGREDLTFRGPGPLSYLDRALMTQCAFSLEGTIVDTWTELWESSGVRYPVGSWYDSSDSGFVRVIDQRSRRLYKINQTTRVATALSGALFSHYAGGLSGDPSDATIYWALEAPWAGGSAAHSYIHKVRKSDNVVLTSFDIGTDRWTGIKAAATHLWLTNLDDEKIYNKSKTTGATVGSRTITYKGTVQADPTGVSVNGTKLGYWFLGKARILIADVSTPGTIERVIATTNLAAFGGDWVTISTEDFLFPITNVVGRTYKYQLTDAIPACADSSGEFHPEQTSPGALAWRVLVEITHPDRPDQPCPELTYDFTEDEDSNGTPWPARTSTEEFTWHVGDRAFSDVLARLIPAGVTFDLDVNTMTLHAYIDADFGTDRTAADFGAGKVRFEETVNLAVNADLAKRDNRGQPATNMTVAGENGVYGSAELSGRYVREGFMSVSGATTSAVLDAIGADELARQRLVAEALGFETLWQNAELAGGYIPKKHYWKGDLVRVDMEPGEFAYDEADLRLYGTLISERDGGWRVAVDLGSAYKVPPPISSVPGTGSTSGTSSGGGASSGSTTITQTIPLVVEGLDDTGAVLTSATGNKIRAVGAQVFQEAVGVIRLVITAATRLLGLDDVDADDITDGQVLAFDAASGTFIPADMATGDGSPQNEITPALQLAIGPWVGPSGAGQVTRDDVHGRVAIDTGASYKAFPGQAYLDGRLHGVYRQASAHVSTGGVIKYRTSDDLGKTWTAAVAIATAPAGAHDYRDPSIVALASGRLLVGIDTATGAGGLGHATGFYSMFSDDRGQTWSALALFPASDTDQGNGTCPAMQLADGRVLMPGYVDPTSAGHYSSVFWLSADEGETWDDYVVIAAYGARDYNETKLLQTADGVLRAFMRTDTGGSPHHTYLATASIDDLATWSAPTSVNSMTGRPDIIEFYPMALFQQGRYNTAGDSALHFSTSWDGGATWATPDEVDVGETAFGMYSAPILLAPGIFVVIYCLENSSSDSDVFIRWYHDGYGTDVSGNVLALVGGTVVDPTPPITGQVLTATGAATAGWADSTAATTTYREVLMASGITDPPDPIISSDGTDWLYGEVS